MIGPLTMEIYYQTGIAGTDTQTDTHTLKLIISGRVKKAHLLSLYLSLSLSPLVSLALSFHLLPFIFTPPQNRGGVIFLLRFVCLSVSVCVCVSVNKIQATDLDAVFAKWLLIALARTLLKLMTLG